MLEVFFVGLGGFAGAVCRYLCTLGISSRLPSGSFPLATLVVNLTGSFIMGFLSQLFHQQSFENRRLYLFLTTGMMGGFTTFSTFSLETVNLFQDGKAWIAACNIALSLVCCLAGVVLGKLLAKGFVR